ncbi:MAG: VCBS repeat-containing protein [Planctomycetes bacterium]|nr:VCBS repeat-containing protein [Planctomycetota bacterium]
MIPFDFLQNSRANRARMPLLAAAACISMSAAARAQSFFGPTIPVAGNPSTLAFGDINSDGRLDLVVGESNISPTVMEVLWGGDGGKFSAPDVLLWSLGLVTDIEIRDINNDGLADLIYIIATGGAPGLFVMYGTGSGRFTFNQLMGGPTGGDSLAFGDVNGDGMDDLVTNDFATNSFVVFERGPHEFLRGIAYPADVGTTNAAFADMNLDGNLDVVCANYFYISSDITISFGDGTGLFGRPLQFKVDAAPTWVAVGDVNGDGFPDAATCHPEAGGASTYSDYIVWLQGDGTGLLNPGGKITTGLAPYRIFTKDLNGDGLDDLLAPRSKRRGFAWVPGRAAGPNRVFVLRTGDAPIWAECADWTGDGLPDVAIANNSGSVTLLEQFP